MSMQSATNPFGGGTTLTDKRFGNTYPIIKSVYDKLAEIAYVAANLNALRPKDVELRMDPDGQYIQWRYVPAADEPAMDWINLWDFDSFFAAIGSEVPVPSKIPQADVNGKIATGWLKVDEVLAGLIADLASTAAGKGAELVSTKLPYAGAMAQTQHVVNAQWVTPKGFGAVGDGVADDSAAVTALEAVYAGKLVDLHNFLHRVSAYPTKNQYANGAFVIPKSTTIGGVIDNYDWRAPAARKQALSPAINLFRDARSTRSGELFRLTQVQGLQGVAFDEVGNSGVGHVYTMHLTGSGASEVSYISQYSMAGEPGVSKAALGVSNSSAQLGHQGLALEQLNNGTVKLWSSVRYEATNYPNGHRQVVRFNYAGNAANVSNVETFTLFGAEFAYTGNSVIPAISYCQRFLVVLGRKASRDFWVRVFDLPALIAGGPGDYSDKWLYEFNVDRDILLDDVSGAFRPVQGVACDGASVYILSGNSSLNGKRIDRYSLDGRLEQSQANISVGLNEATAEGTFYEPEALAMIRPNFNAPPALCMVIVSAGGGAHINRVWALGYKAAVAEGNGTLVSGRWTPTITNGANVAASTAYPCHYMRVGNEVHFAGRIAIDPTSAATFTTLEITLPVPSNFTSLTDAAGVFNAIGVTGVTTTVDTGAIEGSTANDRLVLSFIANDTANRAYYFSGCYEVK